MRRGLALIAVMLGLAGALLTGCASQQPDLRYLQAQQRPPLQVPDDLAQPVSKDKTMAIPAGPVQGPLPAPATPPAITGH